MPTFYLCYDSCRTAIGFPVYHQFERQVQAIMMAWRSGSSLAPAGTIDSFSFTLIYYLLIHFLFEVAVMINVIWNPQLDLGTTTNDDCLNLSFKHLRLIILGREGMVLS